MRLVLLGPPGAGKGTQAKILAERYKAEHISTGDIFRDLIKKDSALGLKIKKYVETGELIPDDIVVEVVISRIKDLDSNKSRTFQRGTCFCSPRWKDLSPSSSPQQSTGFSEKVRDKGFILDGFPRTLEQASMLDSTLKELDISIDKVLYFDTSEGIIIKRLGGRRICRDCGANYHLINMPPKKDGVCDSCGGQLYQRKDDEPATIHNRLKVYQDQTMGLIDYYKKKKILEKINGDLSKDETFKIIETILSKIPSKPR